MTAVKVKDDHRKGPVRERLQRFLADEGIPLQLDALWVDPRQRPSSLCYIQADGAILLLKRNREPFAGYWTAPGGKIRSGEDPREAVVREIREETALRVERPQLRFIASELGPEQAYRWLLFGFVAYGWEGRLGTTPEGELAWVPVSALERTAIPEVDRALLARVLEPPRGQVYLARIRYGPGGSLEHLELTLVREGRRPAGSPEGEGSEGCESPGRVRG